MSSSSSDNVLRRLYVASALCGTFLVLEVAGGLLAGSLAVLSDAAHLVADLAGFAVAIAARHLAALPATQQHTYGLRRTESLAALLSVGSLALVSVWLAYEAVRRLFLISWVAKHGNGESTSVQEVDGALMSLIAAMGVAVNVILAFVLGEHHVHLPGGGGHGHDHSHDHHHHDGGVDDGSMVASTLTADEETHLLGTHHHPDEVDPNYEDCDSDEHEHHECGDNVNTNDKEEGGVAMPHNHELDHHHEHHHHEHPQRRNVNLHAAYLHVLGDLAQWVAVLIAGLVIWIQPAWHWVDPVATLLFCALVFYATLGVMRSSISVLLEEVPPHIRWKQVYHAIVSVASVERVHDLHIWSISDGVPCLSVHCFLVSDGTADPRQALEDVYSACTKFGIRHATIQIQSSSGELDECITCRHDIPCDHPPAGEGW